MLNGIIKTAMVYRYYIKFIMRLTVFICVLVFLSVPDGQNFYRFAAVLERLQPNVKMR